MEKLNDWAEPVGKTDDLGQEIEDFEDDLDDSSDMDDLAMLQITENIASGDPFGWFPK